MVLLVPNTPRGQRNQNVGVWSKERFIVRPCKEKGGGGLMCSTSGPDTTSNPELLEEFQQNIMGQGKEEHLRRVCDQFSDW